MFSVGDHVNCIDGSSGVVVNTSYEGFVGVALREFKYGETHNCHGAAPRGNGYYFYPDELTLNRDHYITKYLDAVHTEA